MTTRIPVRAALIAAATLFITLAVAHAADSNDNTLRKSFAVEPGGTLTVSVDQGSIDVVSADRREVRVEVERKNHRLSAAKFEQIVAGHDVQFSQDGNRVVVRAKFKDDVRKLLNSSGGQFELRFKVEVPPEFNLDLKTGSGSIHVGDVRGDVKCDSGGGSIKVDAIDGPVNAHTSSGSIIVGTCTAAVNVKSGGGSIRIGHVKGGVDAQTSSGSITVERADAALKVRTGGGSIQLGTVGGEGTAETSSGSIRVREAVGKLSVRSGGGSIHLGDLAAAADARTSSGSVKVETAGGSLDAESGGGTITVESAKGATKLRTNSGSVTVGSSQNTLDVHSGGGSLALGKLSGATQAHTSSGSVSATFVGQPEADSKLSSGGGSVQVKLKKDLALKITATSGGGVVSTDLPIDGERTRHAIRGTLNGGGKELVVHSGGGSVSLKAE